MLLDKPQDQPTTGPNTTLPSYSLKPSYPNSTTSINLVECIIAENNALKHQIENIEG